MRDLDSYYSFEELDLELREYVWRDFEQVLRQDGVLEAGQITSYDNFCLTAYGEYSYTRLMNRFVRLGLVTKVIDRPYLIRYEEKTGRRLISRGDQDTICYKPTDLCKSLILMQRL